MNDDELGRLRAYADGELDEIEARRVHMELAESSASQRALRELETLDASVDELLRVDADAPATAAAWRTFRARAAEPAPRRRLPIAIGIVSLLAAAILFMVVRPAPSAGSLVASQRETVAIGSRATAVAEAGATLAWEVDGPVRVRQSSGAVFYRVDAGDAFVVDTPVGRVTVTGTCFTVELQPMNSKLRTLASAAAGAAAATAVFVTVHEGSVVLGNDRGDVEVAAGQRAHAGLADSPSLDEDDDEKARVVDAAAPSRKDRFAALVRENQSQREQLRKLHEEASAREKAEGGAAVDADVDVESPEYRRKVAEQCAANGECDHRLWTDPSQEELVELAKCNRLLVDTPSFLGGGDHFPPGVVIEAAGLSEDEALRYAELAEGYHGEVAGELEGLAAELGVPRTLVDRLSPVQLSGLVESIVDHDTHQQTRRIVTQERAGMRERPGDERPSAGERALRLLWGQGDAFERKLAAEFGPDVAQEMRDAAGGWSNKSSIGDGMCDG